MTPAQVIATSRNRSGAYAKGAAKRAVLIRFAALYRSGMGAQRPQRCGTTGD
jgi:hypothetical protein